MLYSTAQLLKIMVVHCYLLAFQYPCFEPSALLLPTWVDSCKVT